MKRRITPFLIVALCCLVLSGCTRKQEENGAVIHSYQLWVGFAGVAIGVAATAAGWIMKSKGGRGWVFFILALIGTLTFSPFGFFDHVTVAADRLQTRWGFWCFPTTHDIAFDNVSGVALTKKTSTGRRGRRTSYNLEFHLRDGKTESLSATNTLMEEAADELVERLAAKGIEVHNQTGE